VLFIAAAIVVFFPSGKSVFLETTLGRYRVLSASVLVGTNLVFARDHPIGALYRRIGKAAGLPVRGVSDGYSLGSQKKQVIAVLCDGHYPTNRSTQIFEAVAAESMDETGRTISFGSMTFIARNDAHFWILWEYREIELSTLEGVYTNRYVTNFHPKQLLLFRKSDHHELTRLDLSH
jgi:hypothetical protein